MERFNKIKGPKPQAPVEILVLPNPRRVWGTHFVIESSQREINWVCNQSGILAFVEVGKMAIRSEAGSLVLSSKALVFIPPQCPYLEQRMGIRTSGWYISLPKALCQSLPKTIALLNPSDLLLAVGVKIVSVKSQVSISDNGKNLISILIGEIKSASRVKCLAIPIPHSEKLRRVTEKIANDPSDMQNIDTWAKSAGMSRRAFTKQFAEETGLSFAVWRRMMKLSAAIEEFEIGKSIGDISFHLGYQNPSAFISVFKKQFGMSPAKFLKENFRRRNKR